MNVFEIEEAISKLAEEPFDADSFPFAFLEAFGNKKTTIQRLRSGNSNASDVERGVLQRGNIHIAVCPTGDVTRTLGTLQSSPATSKKKAKFILATDGIDFGAENLNSGDTIICDYGDFPDHFGFFLPLAGITPVKEIRENAVDIRATNRLNRLYIELLKDNEVWESHGLRHDMNQFMARLIFCFFAEDTDIFMGDNLFTSTIEQMSDSREGNTDRVIAELFRAMDTPIKDRSNAKLRPWADGFPYVNGGLFGGSRNVPKFSRIARSHLLHIGTLDWKKINPDIFGSMIQTIADEEERGGQGMHYTSVPNIMKVLNPLFLDNLRERLEVVGTDSDKLQRLKTRMKKIRVFDPACGSGNFLVIAYKEIRAIEATINQRRGDAHAKSVIPLTNFRGIELRDFSAEVARLALTIAKYQCDVIHRGQKEALKDFLPLDSMNWITCGNALQLDWLDICPPTGTAVKYRADDLFQTPLNQPEINFKYEGGETFICGNPPYRGSTWQSEEQKDDLRVIFAQRTKKWKSLDYVAGWFMKAADYGKSTATTSAFVATNSICQGQQVPILWPLIFASGHKIAFAHNSFKWANLASHNAGVTVAIIGISTRPPKMRRLYSNDPDGKVIGKTTANINAYLVPSTNVIVGKIAKPICELMEMSFGNKPVDGGHLLLTRNEVEELGLSTEQRTKFIRQIYGSKEFIRGEQRYCLWIEDQHLAEAMAIIPIRQRIEKVKSMRLASPDSGANAMASNPHQFREMNIGQNHTIVVPRVSSENRGFLPVGLIHEQSIASDRTFGLYDGAIWNMALIASRLHFVWIATVCGRLETRISYSNTLGWNTFPIPTLTKKNKADLTHCAENILLAREAHFPATIADLYAPEAMPDNIRQAHDDNDDVLERIYIGRRFKNDTERLEELFNLYTKMTASPAPTTTPSDTPEESHPHHE